MSNIFKKNIKIEYFYLVLFSFGLYIIYNSQKLEGAYGSASLSIPKQTQQQKSPVNANKCIRCPKTKNPIKCMSKWC